jgi:Cu+-exporting ATPase
MPSVAPAVESASPVPAAGARACRHCGDPCGAAARETPAGPFCCAGCESVFSILDTHGLLAFYTCDVQPGQSQRRAGDRDPGRFAALDDPDVAARFVRPAAAGLARATFSTPSIHCASCLWLLEQLWRFDDGVGRSEADVLARTVRVDFDPRRIGVRAIAERLASLGYEPVLDAERALDAPPAGRRALALRIGVAGFAFGNVMLFSVPRYVNGAPLEPAFALLFGTLNLVFSIPVLLYSASPFFRGAWHAARARTITLDVPIAIGLAALFGRSVVDIGWGLGEGFLDSFAGLVFFLLIGRAFQQKAFDRITFDRTLRSFLPISVQVERAGATALTRIEQLSPGDVIVLRPQEVVPADGIALNTGRVDCAFVTGEQAPLDVAPGQTVPAGARIVDRATRVRVTRAVSQSTLSRLWTNPVFDAEKRPWLTDLLARFGAWFTFAAIVLAAAGAIAWWPDTRRAVEVATAVLIIACPCAFTLAAPITLGTAMGVLARAGLYLKRAAVALDLGRVSAIVFDKTGTLTTIAPDAVTPPAGMTPADWTLVRRLAAHSVHPVSRAIARGLAGGPGVTDLREHRGQGLAGAVDGAAVRLGSAAFVAGEIRRPVPAPGGVTWASVDDHAPAPIPIGGVERPGIAAAALAVGRRSDTWLVSGDHATDAARWAPIFGERVLFRQSPEDKLAAVQALQLDDRRVLMVGDGLNDAGALAAADVGLAVSDDTACLVPACDAVIRGDRLAALPAFLAYARRARAVMALCFVVSLLYNAAGLTLALTGQLTPLATAVLMPVSSLTIVGLSVGLMRVRTRQLLES